MSSREDLKQNHKDLIIQQNDENGAECEKTIYTFLSRRLDIFFRWESLQLCCILGDGEFQNKKYKKNTARDIWGKDDWLRRRMTLFIFLPPFEGSTFLWPENSHNSSLIHAGIKFHSSLAPDVKSS